MVLVKTTSWKWWLNCKGCKYGNPYEKDKQCSEVCDYASFHAGNFRTHLKTHSGGKSNKCNQCGYASSWADTLRAHLKAHSGEKSNKCNQCDYASSHAGHLRRHLKTHSGEKTNAPNALCSLREQLGVKKFLKVIALF